MEDMVNLENINVLALSLWASTKISYTTEYNTVLCPRKKTTTETNDHFHHQLIR